VDALCSFGILKVLRKSTHQLLWFAAIFGALLLSILSCEREDDAVDVEALIAIHCGSCHLVPDPGELTRDRWEEFVLPRMGYFLGIYESPEERAELIEASTGGEIVEAAEVFPKKPLIDREDWQHIVNYYLDLAPEKIEVAPKQIPATAPFAAEFPEMYLSPPSTTLTQFSNDGGIFLGDAHTGQIFDCDNRMEPLSNGKVGEGAVGIEAIGGQLLITVMGQFSPTDAALGYIVALPEDRVGSAEIIIDQLQRPVHTAYGDLHGEGRTDIVVCEFGKWTGGLTLFHAMEDGSYERHRLLNTPGATRAYIQDMNSDGRSDIVALFAQGSEGIDIFYNKGNSEFSRVRVLRFPSTYGSSYFDLFDFNDDGNLDIIYTAGDNADFKPLMKPYHGVYVYLNDGDNRFEQAFFQHINGAYKAIPADFDSDGDIDIATISFFPDWELSPDEGFVYLENTGEGDFDFNLSTFKGVGQGRWITMDAADIDLDGDHDLVLGSLAFETTPDLGHVEKWSRNGIPFVVLRNLVEQ